jgi:hypothetical protein
MKNPDLEKLANVANENAASIVAAFNRVLARHGIKNAKVISFDLKISDTKNTKSDSAALLSLPPGSKALGCVTGPGGKVRCG